MSAVETTVPLPSTNRVTFRVGDRVTYLCTDTGDTPLQLVGDVTATNGPLFEVRWISGHGTARFTHGHEPPTFRRANAQDERDAVPRATRATVAHELLRLADTNTVWPNEIRTALRRRAAELSR